MIFEPIAKTVGTGAYLTIYFIGVYIIKNLLLLLTLFVESIVYVLTKIAHGIIWVAKGIGTVIEFIWTYSGGFIVKVLVKILDTVVQFGAKGRIQSVIVAGAISGIIVGIVRLTSCE